MFYLFCSLSSLCALCISLFPVFLIDFDIKGEYTVPSTIGQEIEWNLFMKCREDRTQSIMKSDDPEKVMSLLREGKNNFR